MLTKDSMQVFDEVSKPPLSPGGWLFPVVWTILYLLMGLASYLVLTARVPMSEKKLPLIFYAAQLAVNFFWSIFFFNYRLYLFSFVWLVLLWLLIVITTVLFYRVSRVASVLLVPYILWVTFAGYLNFGIYLLN